MVTFGDGRLRPQGARLGKSAAARILPAMNHGDAVRMGVQPDGCFS